MAVATLYYHDSTGADTNSGSNAPTTAHTDSSLSETISGTGGTTTFTFSGTIDVTGVADDGTDLLWVASTAGERHLWRITAFAGVDLENCTGLTVAEDIGGTTITALAWGIGGKRLTLQNDSTRFDFEDVMGGWEMIFNDGGSFTLDSNNDVTWGGGGTKATGPNIMRTAAGYSTRATIVQNGVYVQNMLRTNGFASNNFIEVHDLIFECQTNNGSGIWELDVNNVSHLFRNCLFVLTEDRNGSGIITDMNSSHITVEDCVFTAPGATIGTGIHCSKIANVFSFRRCRFTDLGDEGIVLGISSGSWVFIEECIFDGCTDGIEIEGTAVYLGVNIFDCSFYNQSAHGISLSESTIPDRPIHRIQRCIFFDNGGYGINVADADGAAQVLCENNAFYSNTSGETVNTTNIDHITMTADPFTDAAGADFSLNSTAGGGAAVDDEALEIAN